MNSVLQTLLVLFISALAFAQAPQGPAAVGRRALDLLLAEKYTELSGMLAPVRKGHAHSRIPPRPGRS